MVPSKAPEATAKRGETLSLAKEHAPAHVEKGEAQHTGGGPGPAVQHSASVPTLPVPQAPVVTSKPQAADSNPTNAADEDLVEKEWVDKAKKIVNETKNDPYAQGKEISKLQADYLKKRYGKEIKLSGD
jgi:Txe/YoeB family toxin of Txe-Axe toxin-antitoxin module